MNNHSTIINIEKHLSVVCTSEFSICGIVVLSVDCSTSRYTCQQTGKSSTVACCGVLERILFLKNFPSWLFASADSALYCL